MKFICIAVIAVSISSSCFGQSAHDIAQVAFKSVVVLEMNDSNGQPLSLASGFFVSEGIIATNAHVIEGASSGMAKLVADNHTMQILGTVAVNRDADLALLKVDSFAPSLILGPSSSPLVGDNVYVVGNPLGLEGTFSEGIISGIRAVGTDTILQMTAPISPGSSGGPVMNSSGAVIGVAEATLRDGQNLNLAVPMKYLTKLLAMIAEPVKVIPLGQTAHAPTSKSIVDSLGARIESCLIASDLQITPTQYSFRLSNKLPVDVTNIHWRIIYYDASGSVMDYEESYYPSVIAAGLAKTVVVDKTPELTRALSYYHSHGPKGGEIGFNPVYNERTYQYEYPGTMVPKIEIRIVGFSSKE